MVRIFPDNSETFQGFQKLLGVSRDIPEYTETFQSLLSRVSGNFPDGPETFQLETYQTETDWTLFRLLGNFPENKRNSKHVYLFIIHNVMFDLIRWEYCSYMSNFVAP